MLRNTVDSYGSVSKSFHWGVGSLIIILLGVGVIMTGMAPSPLKMTLYTLHKSTGVIVFLLVLLRLAWRLSSVSPLLPSTLASWHYNLAKSSSLILYCLMVIMPLSGFIMSDAAARPVTVYNLYTLPHFFPKNSGLSRSAALVHFYAGYGFIGILVLHFAAAVYHHAILKNDILKRMLPSRNRSH